MMTSGTAFSKDQRNNSVKRNKIDE